MPLSGNVLGCPFWLAIGLRASGRDSGAGLKGPSP
jgi:hypothetical protein